MREEREEVEMLRLLNYSRDIDSLIPRFHLGLQVRSRMMMGSSASAPPTSNSNSSSSALTPNSSNSGGGGGDSARPVSPKSSSSDR